MKRSVLLIALSVFLLSFIRKEKESEFVGIASYYHSKFEGRKTSSGEVFSNNNLTAAHKTMRLGTWVKVTNLKNDSVVIVKINDRLPSTSKRLIDLSVRAATQLNFIRAGLTKVRIEVTERLKD
ncbi:MAG: septal ring lytic transglycosylase RlpA family protein [Bacteroidia bacterium]